MPPSSTTSDRASRARVREEIRRLYGGAMLVGCATCVPTGAASPRYLISTPTMTRSAESVRGTLNVALACAAAFQAIHMQNAREPDSIRSVALPGLGAATGRVPARRCASLMWTGYRLFRDAAFADFGTMRAALLDQLGGIDELPAARGCGSSRRRGASCRIRWPRAWACWSAPRCSSRRAAYHPRAVRNQRGVAERRRTARRAVASPGAVLLMVTSTLASRGWRS